MTLAEALCGFVSDNWSSLFNCRQQFVAWPVYVSGESYCGTIKMVLIIFFLMLGRSLSNQYQL